MTRKIKTLTDKGFGFLAMGGGEKDLFFHAKSLKNTTFDALEVGDELEFDVEEGEKGPMATNVVKL